MTSAGQGQQYVCKLWNYHCTASNLDFYMTASFYDPSSEIIQVLFALSTDVDLQRCNHRNNHDRGDVIRTGNEYVEFRTDTIDTQYTASCRCPVTISEIFRIVGGIFTALSLFISYTIFSRKPVKLCIWSTVRVLVVYKLQAIKTSPSLWFKGGLVVSTYGHRVTPSWTPCWLYLQTDNIGASCCRQHQRPQGLDISKTADSP